jgi:hypothetical protein
MTKSVGNYRMISMTDYVLKAQINLAQGNPGKTGSRPG